MKSIDLEIEKKEIINKYRALLRACNDKTNKEDKKNIRKAFNLAVKAHENVRRKSGEPYILHPIAVAHICAKEIGLGTISIICALLHDVVEDTDYTIEDIEKLFGAKIASIINGLTNQSHPCQIIADLMTLEENFKSLKELKLCWVGDGNNVCNSWIQACLHYDFNLHISCPKNFFPQKS